MKKNKQIIIFSLIGILVLGAVVAVLLLTEPKEKEAADETKTEAETVELTLVKGTAAEVEKLTVKNSEGSYDITPDGKDDDGCVLWTIEEISSATLVQGTFETVVGKAAALTASALVEENAQELSKYGLDSPIASYTVLFTDGTEFSLDIGDNVPNSATKTYASPTGSGTVYVCASSALAYFSYSKFDYVNTVLMESASGEQSPEITKLTIERKELEKPIVIEMLPDAAEGDLSVFSYTLTSPYNVYLDLTNGSKYLYALYGLTASSVEWVGMEQSDYELSGLDDPNCTVTMLVGGKTYTLKIGKAIAEKSTAESGKEVTTITGYYAMFSEIPDVLFRLDATSVPFMTMTAESCMSKLFLMPYINTLDKVVYKDAEQTLEFDTSYIAPETEDGAGVNEVSLNGEKQNIDRFKELYQFMVAARGEEVYTDSARGEFIASLTYVYDDASRASDTVEFYSSPDDRKTIICLNGNNLFKVRQMYVTRLQENVGAFLGGNEIVLTY